MEGFEEIESAEAFQWPRGQSTERRRMVEQVLNVQFPQAVRGYDRAAVDRHMEEIRAVIAELEAAASPDATVQRAIEEISDETRDVLLRAQQSAQEISTRARDRAETLVTQSEREAEETLSAARQEAQETRETVRREATKRWEENERNIDELRESAEREVTERRTVAQREVEELWATAQREAAELRATARQETDQMIAAAESRIRELNDSAERLLAERQRLLDDMQSVAEQLGAISRAESGRFPEAGGSEAPGQESSGGIAQ